MKYLLYLTFTLIIGYFSIKITPLDKIKTANEKFDATKFANNFYTIVLPKSYSKAIDIQLLISKLKSDKTNTFRQYSNTVAIGNVSYFLVKGQATVTKINRSDIELAIDNFPFKIATEFIYGNALRDASGQFDIKPFTQTADINNISAELNKIIRKTVVPPFLKHVKIGEIITFVGAVELNKEHTKYTNIEVQPLQLIMLKK